MFRVYLSTAISGADLPTDIVDDSFAGSGRKYLDTKIKQQRRLVTVYTGSKYVCVYIRRVANKSADCKHVIEEFHIANNATASY